MGEIPALLRLDRLNPACVIGVQHNARPIWSIDERQATAIALQVAEFIDKVDLVHTKIGSYSCNIFISQTHIAFPTAAGTATLAGMDDGFRWLVHISHGLRIGAVMCGGRT